MKSNQTKNTTAVYSFILLISFMLTSHAGDIETGKAKAMICVSCHGPEGISSHTTWPNLAGKPEAYLITMLQLFRDGRRQNPWMSPMATSLSDQEIEDLAAFFSTLSSLE